MRRRILVAAGVLLLLAGGATAYYLKKHRFGGDVIGSTGGFDSTQTITAPKAVQGIVSPMFGVGPQRLHVGVGSVHPPFRLDWAAQAGALVEFPPALAFRNLYYATGAGDLIAATTGDGRRLWTVRVNRCEAASPAVSAFDHGTVYETFLNHGRCKAGVADPSDGLVIALSTGPSHAVRWQRNLGASETSPLLVGQRLYIGTAAGDVYCLRADNGKTLWRYHVDAAVKGGIAYDRGKVFFGAYDGHLYALGATGGKLVWTASSATDFSGGHGTFYSTPAVAYSRVYIGSTDGKVYAFDERSGRLAWAHGTGGYVYGSPAVDAGRVYIGSYDNVFYALSAATGAPVWTYRADGQISGSATIVDGVVYFATLRARHTFGLDERTGKKVWFYKDGAFGAIVADKSRLYVVGWGKIYAFSPVRKPRR